MGTHTWPRLVALVSCVTAIGLLVGCTSSTAVPQAVPGAGDAYYPQLGSDGYDVQHYDLDLTVDPTSGTLTGTATIEARAKRRLPSIPFDLVGMQVSAVSVDSRPAHAERPDAKLLVTSRDAVPAGQVFTVVVRYHGTPRPIPDPSGNSTGAAKVGWHHDGDEVYVASEPAGARTWYPVNDTPRDKATYTFHITVPEGYTAVANGLSQAPSSTAGHRTYTWATRHPMASYLATIDVGHFTEQRGTGPHGLPILGYAPPQLADRAARRFAQVPEIIAYFEGILGRYPFESAGQVVVDQPFRWSLETQTRPVYGNQILGLLPDVAEEGISHELAHQWFGDSVTPHDWSDIWLNEGFATYLSWLWMEHLGRRDFLRGLMRDQYGYLLDAPDYATLLDHSDLPAGQILPIVRRLFRPDGHPTSDQEILAATGLSRVDELTVTKALGLLGVKPDSADAADYRRAARSSAPASLPRENLFTPAVYARGAMALQALRIRVGDPAFFRALRTYAARFRDGNATTSDFIVVANTVTGQDLKPFFHTWLYDPRTPPMPALLPTQ